MLQVMYSMYCMYREYFSNITSLLVNDVQIWLAPLSPREFAGMVTKQNVMRWTLFESQDATERDSLLRGSSVFSNQKLPWSEEKG